MEDRQRSGLGWGVFLWKKAGVCDNIILNNCIQKRVIIMETHYLIDYENDGKNGLKGCEKLTGSDFIHLFYTDNSKNTTLDIFTNHGKAELYIKKVPVGAQSLDKHLIAYLGYLVGKNANIQAKYVIISSDKGYDKVCEFLRNECGNSISVSRRNMIAFKQVTQKKEVEQNAEKKTIVSKVDPAKKTKLNQQIQQALSSSETQYRPGVMNEVAKVVTSLYGNEKFLNDVHNALRGMYPEDYLDVYGDIKSILSKYTTNQDKKADCNNKKLLHNEIQQILSKANVGKEVIAYVLGLVIKHCDEKKALQTIYREIIQKFGQKKGLDIYNRIKKYIQEGEADGEPEVFTYNSFPQAFRNQVFYILEDVLEPYSKYDENLWNVFEE